MSFLWHGLTDQGSQVPIQVDALGRVIAVDGTPGGSKWTRTGTTLTPSIPGDSVDVGLGNLTTLGRLLVGTTTSSQVGGGLDAALQVESTSQAGSRFSILRRSSNSAGPVIALGKSGGSANEVVAEDDALGTIDFAGGDGTDVVTSAARIRCDVDGTPGANDMPGRLVFSTTADGASSPTERMRIKANGTINFSSVATYADNTAAKAGGLVNGDVYRTATGQLMIVT